MARHGGPDGCFVGAERGACIWQLMKLRQFSSPICGFIGTRFLMNAAPGLGRGEAARPRPAPGCRSRIRRSVNLWGSCVPSPIVGPGPGGFNQWVIDLKSTNDAN